MSYKYKMTFWREDENEIIAFISEGRKNYNIYIGNPLNKNLLSKVGKTLHLKIAKEKLGEYFKAKQIPYVIRTSVDEYFNGDHCSLRFEHFNANGECFKKYYEADYSTNKYFYYTTSTGKDILMIERV